MSPPELPNPERRSDAALLCLGLGALLVGLSWLMGVGGVLAAALSRGAGAGVAGGVAAMIALPILAFCGGVLMIVGAIWIIARVIADQRADHAKDRYKDVQR